MIRPADLPDVLPVFPLAGALLLPRANLPLNLFEPRYLAMLEDVLKTSGRIIGMVQPISEDRLNRIGCAGRVTQFAETTDGRYMITLTGVSRFRIMDEIEGFTPYRRMCVSWEDFERDLGPSETDDDFDRAGFLDLLQRYFYDHDLNTDWETVHQAENELLINSLSMMLGFAPEEKQALLEAPSLTTRRETLVALLEFALRGGEADEILQ